MLIADTSRAEAGACKPCLAYRFFVGEKCYTKHAAPSALLLIWNLPLRPIWLAIFYQCKNLLIKELTIKIEWEVIEKHNLYSPMQKSNMQIWKWGDLLLPLLQLIKLSLLEITWVLFPLQPYSIGQTEKYIATDESHHLGTLCFQLPAEALSKTLQLSL